MNKQQLLKALESFLKRADPEHAAYHRIADKAAPEVQAAFLKAIAKVQGSVTLKYVEDALAKGDLLAAENAINWTALEVELGAIGKTITQVFTESATVAAKRLGEQLGFNPIVYEGGVPPKPPTGGLVGMFDLRNLEAEKWIEQYVGDEITLITEETKQAIRSIILDGAQNGRAPRETARDIRQHIGLTDRDAKAVLNYRAKLEGMMLDGKSPFSTVKLTPEKIDSLVEKYSKKKLRERSETIARTETIKASNMGQQNIWRDAVSQGLLPQTVRRKWSTAEDERVCSWCGPLDGTIVGMEETFTITASKTENSQKITYAELTPPLHPQCRCSMVLEQG